MAGRMSCDYDDFDDAVFECGQELKALVEENLGSIENIPMMWKDMIDASFREINFNEISKHLIEEARIEMANN